jgi:RecB family exonuclease
MEAAKQQPLPGLDGADESGTPAPGSLLIVPHGAPARDELVALIARLRADDPLAPVTVAVPSPLAGLSLRRVVGARTGLVNVHFTALARVAELLGAPSLAAGGRRPLTAALRLEAIHTALAGDEGPLAPVSSHPATAAALAVTFTELDETGDAARAEIAGRSERAAAVVRLYDAFRALTADCYDATDILRAAARAVDDGADAATEVGQVVVHLPSSLTGAEEALLGALARRDRLTVVLGRCGDDGPDTGLTDALAARLRRFVGAPIARASDGVPHAQRLLSAPDPDDEVRSVARELQDRARRGEPLGRVALLYRVATPYARLIPEVLDAAGIPWTGAAPRRVADAAAGRVLLGLLALVDSDLARDDVAAWLASGPVIDPADGRRVNATRWDVMSREAGVVGGAEQWAERLRLHRESIDAELVDVEAAGEATEWQVRRLHRARDDTDALAEFVADVAAALTPPEPTTWASLADWAAALLARYAGSEGQRHDWPEREVEAARVIAASLDELGSLDAVGGVTGGPLDLARFRRTLEAELDTRLERVGRFGTGVLIGALGQAYAADFDAVYVLGAVEGTLPPRGREDPLLPDRERRGIDELPQHATRRLEERRDYLAALASAPARVLTFPRADPRAQRKRLPARWVLESATALAGRDMTAEELRDEIGASDWLAVVDSFEGLVTRGDPASDTEYTLRSLRAWYDAGRDPADHPLASGDLARGYVAASARGGWHASSYDGFLGDSPDLAPGHERATSPTALQSWADCPFRYYLGRVLRLHDIPRPEATEAISALDEGSLVHAILEEFVRDSPTPATPTTPWTDADRVRMAEIVDRHCEDAERRGITGRPILWKLARRRIVATASRFLHADENVRAALGVLPAPDGLERGFGTDGAPPVEVDVGREQPVRFRGRIDRVDRSPDGRRTVVYDYKTGGRRRYAALGDDPVHGGRLLQLPVYALAARAQEGTDEARAAYWFTADPPDAPLLQVELDDATEERFVEVVSTIVGGIAQGCFPAYPGERAWDARVQRETWASCLWCEFDRLCPVDRGAAWERVAEDAAAAAFVALDEIDVDDPGDEAGDEAGT